MIYISFYREFDRTMVNIRQLAFKVRRRLLSCIWQLQCSISPNRMAIFTLPDGSRFDYPLKSAIGRALFTGGFETAEVEFVRRSLKPGDIFLDVGANGGIFTVIAAKQVGIGGHVYAFEPGLRELKLLRHNIEINSLTNVTIIEQAISNKSGVVQFAIARDGAMNSLSKNNHPSQQIEEWQTVEVTTIDSFLNNFGISKIDFIKIDVEGAEKLVFEGAKDILNSDNKITVLFEAFDLNASGFGYSVEELLSELLNFGFYIYYINETGCLCRITDCNAKIGREIYNFILFNKPA